MNSKQERRIKRLQIRVIREGFSVLDELLEEVESGNLCIKEARIQLNVAKMEFTQMEIIK